ncbi:basal-body rod modification protein FlgD [Escherichia coli]|nr:basal-body rod modification protein FlgD [Escherichia coli]
MENNELTSQLAQISTVSGIEKLNTTLDLFPDRLITASRYRPVT